MKKENFIIDFKNPISNNSGESNVYKAINKTTKEEYAIKKVSLLDDIEEELEILEKLNPYENSIKYFGSFKDNESRYIVMELCDYSLSKKIFEKKKLKENFALKDIKEIFTELNKLFIKMKEKKIIHGNLKPENILAKMVNNKLIYKLTDYGKSKQNKKIKKYQAPEYDNIQIDDKSKIDLWSIGVILYELYFGEIPSMPIEHKNLEKSDSEFFDDLIRGLLIKTPFEKNEKNLMFDIEEEEEEEEIVNNNKNNRKIRISWEEYFNHDFFKNDYIKEMISLKNYFNDFKNEIKKIISYINTTYKNFKTALIKEEEEFCSNEYSNKIKVFAKLLSQYKFDNTEESILKFFELTKQSIKNENVINEYVEIFNTELYIYKGEVKKGTKIKNGKGKEYHLNGELLYEGEYNNDKREGNGIEYSEEGEPIFKGEFKEGKHWTGIKKIFEEYEDENEQIKKYIKCIIQINKGKLNGKCKEFDIDGNVIYEGEYSNGKRHGIGKEYSSNKNIDFDGEFKEGKRWEGNANEFNTQGNLIFNGLYLNGKKFNGKEYNYFDDEEKIRYEAEYKDGLLYNVKGYNKDGKIFNNIDFEIKNGDGVFKDYYNDTNLKCIFNYKQGKKNGKAISYYDTSGNKIEYEGEFVDDIKTGEWKFYYENGNKKFVGFYKNGEKHGLCKDYNEQGKLIFDGEYNNNIKWNGKERLIKDIENKKIVIERNYTNGKAECVEYYEHKKYDPQLFDIKGLEFIQKLIKEGKDKKDLSDEINYETYITNLLFVGEHVDNKNIKDKTNRNGKGYEYYENKFVFEGEYKNGKIKNGKGMLYNHKGNIIFNGDYINGKRNGIVYEYYENNENILNINILSEYIALLKYEGKFIDDEKNGLGKEYQYDENNEPVLIFEGIFKNGKKWEGNAKEYYKIPDKLTFDGEYKEGKKWKGNFYEYSNIMDRLKLKGKYVDGKKVNIKKNKDFENLSFD